jgi:hypothetical protein
MKILGKAVLLAVASLALAATGARAQSTINSAIGDLILGFKVTDNTGQGATQNLEVDFGNVSQFINATSTLTLNATSPSSGGLAVADLIATYGANWASRSDLAWGVIATSGRVNPSGVPGVPVSNVWAGEAESPAGTPNPNPYISESKALQNAASTQYEAMVVNNNLDPSSLFHQTSTVNSTDSAVVDATVAGSWTFQQNALPNTEFGFFNGTPMDTIVNDVGTGVTSIDDFYHLIPQAGTGTAPAVLLGTFSLNQNGTLTYTPVPEPSSIGLMGVGFLSLIGMVVLRRRRSVVA